MKLIQEAQAYEPKQGMGNIAELEKVSVDLDLKKETRQDKDGNDYNVLYIIVDDKEFRVPPIVLGHLKTIVAAVPDLKFFKVIKQGEGVGTTYQVVPLTN